MLRPSSSGNASISHASSAARAERAAVRSIVRVALPRAESTSRAKRTATGSAAVGVHDSKPSARV
jgi:hypothetical protein